MTAEQRLEQLEPLVAEAIAVLDRHTAQLVRLNNNVNQLIDIVTKQSENISFLLEENVKVQNQLAHLEADVAELKTDVAELKTDVAELKTDVTELKEGQTRIESKLDLILSKLK